MIRDKVRGLLINDATLADLHGGRVFLRRGPYGGISREGTPEAFTPLDHDLRPSIVVVEEVRTTTDAMKPGDPETRHAIQVVALYCYQQTGYDAIDALIRGAKRILHRACIGPVPPDVWVESRWSSDGPDQLDAALGVPVRVSRFDVLITEKDTP